MVKKVCVACGSPDVQYNQQYNYYKCNKCEFVFEMPVTTFRNWYEDPSINNPFDEEETGESDVEEDDAFLEEEDMGW